MESSERDSAHILLEVTDSRDDAATLNLARSVIDRINEGEDFAMLVEELSDDVGSVSLGGVLGLAGKGVFYPSQCGLNLAITS